jgi:hypothetical protein
LAVEGLSLSNHFWMSASLAYLSRYLTDMCSS